MIAAFLYREKSFTLIELMISVVIFSIILLAIFQVLHVGDISWHTGEAKVNVQQEARRALESMSKELVEADIVIPAEGTSTDTTTFLIPESVTGGVISWSPSYQYLLSGDNQLIRQAPDGAQTILANYISQVDFNRLTYDELMVTVTATKKSLKGNILTATFIRRIFLRNL